MNSVLLYFTTSLLLRHLVNTHDSVRQLFYPGTTSSFDFFHLSPELKKYDLYEKYCVERKCDISVHQNFHREVPTNGTSRFSVSSASHEGSYMMAIKSGDIGFIIPYILNITASYLCMQKPEDYLSRALPEVNKRGRGVVVPCTVLGDPLPSVTWRKRDGEKFVDIISDDDKYTISNLGHLFISNFSDSDVGFYSCSATNNCGERCHADSQCSKHSAQSPDYELRIEDDIPTPTYSQLNRIDYYFLNPKNVKCWIDSCFSYHRTSSNLYMYIRPHDDVNVEVFADMHSNSSYVGYEMKTLVRSPRFISYSEKVCTGVLRNYTNKDVLINSVDCGTYYSSQMISQYLANYRIAITEPLKIKSTSQIDIVEYGANFTIDFKVTGGHSDDLHTAINVDEIACYKNGEEFQMEAGWHKQCAWNANTKTVSILIICTTDTDTGYYQVRVKNWSGTSISDPLYVETYPHTETSRNCFSLRHTVLSPRSVRLEWDSPRANQNKALIYQIVLQNRAWKENLDPSHTVKLSTVVENLHPGTPYYAYVQSKGDLVGHRIEFNTHEERPGATPTEVQCEAQEGTTALYCVWNEIPLKERNGKITSYKVKYRLHYEWEFNFTSVDYIRIPDLQPVALYTVQVMGCTAVGCGLAKELQVITNEDKPTYRPVLRYIISGAKNIRIGWVKPAGSFKNIFYIVDCKRKETGLSIFKKNVSDVDAVIAGQAVKSNTEYIISITPETSQGFGPALSKDVSTLSGCTSTRSSFLVNFFSVLIVFDCFYWL